MLEISVPHPAEGQTLASALLDNWPSYLGFLLSFSTIGIMWMNHHGLFKDIGRVDHTLLVLNLLLLMSISFLPFPTAVLAEHLSEDEHRKTAILFYSAIVIVTAFLFNALWLYASIGRRLIDEHVSDARVRSRTWRYLPGPLIYLIGLPLALISPWITIGLYLALAVLYLLPFNE